MISVLIVDDHPIVLEESKTFFGDNDILIETEQNATDVLAKMINTHFDVFLLDVNMAVQNGLSLAADIKAVQEQALIILYTGDDIQTYYPFIVDKKVDGILSKTSSHEKVIQTIRSLVQGDLILSFDFINYIVTKMQYNYNS